MRHTRPSRPTRQIPLFLPARPEPRVDLVALPHWELIRALAELLLRAAAAGGAATGRPLMTNRITPDHLQRAAIVYVRQSNPEQVRHHGESTRIQVGLRDKAVAFGWRDPVTILDDLGVSAGGFAHWASFQHLAAEVSLGRVGIILSFEASRLSRNSKDWAQLFEVCGHLDPPTPRPAVQPSPSGSAGPGRSPPAGSGSPPARRRIGADRRPRAIRSRPAAPGSVAHPG
jgi:hypothetical protein